MAEHEVFQGRATVTSCYHYLKFCSHSKQFKFLSSPKNKDEKKINLIGSGPSISKTITCAEIVKRKARVSVGIMRLNEV